jgi:hypothetical protein
VRRLLQSPVLPFESYKSAPHLSEITLRLGMNTPNFWPVSFQIIARLSESGSGGEASNKPESVLTNVRGSNPQFVAMPPGGRIVLKDLIRDCVFQNQIVRFDPSVQLCNVTFINCVLTLPSQDMTRPLSYRKKKEGASGRILLTIEHLDHAFWPRACPSPVTSQDSLF